jgi:hypothetical protein
VDGWTYDFCEVAIAARTGQTAMSAVPFMIALMAENPFPVQARMGHYNDQRQVEIDTFKRALNEGTESVTQTKKTGCVIHQQQWGKRVVPAGFDIGPETQ